MRHDVDQSGVFWPVLGGGDVPAVVVERDVKRNGGYVVTAGADEGFPVSVLVRPVGSLEFSEETARLVAGPFASVYVDDLLAVLEQARRIADS